MKKILALLIAAIMLLGSAAFAEDKSDELYVFVT